jgi:hypothetical protein
MIKNVPFRRNELRIPFQSLVEDLIAASHFFVVRATTTTQDRTPLIPVDPGSQGMLSTTLGPLVAGWSRGRSIMGLKIVTLRVKTPAVLYRFAVSRLAAIEVSA